MSEVSIRKAIHAFAAAASMATILASAPSSGQDALKHTPFNYGDQMPDLVATCEDIRSWLNKAPKSDMRIDLAIRGELSRVHADGALVYLTMCGEPNPQVMCVTYRTNGMSAGDVVTFAGGFRQLGSERIVLDPCLASRR